MNHTLKKGEILSVAGPAFVRVKRGMVEIVGAPLKPSRVPLKIPEGKTVPFEARKPSVLSITGADARVEEIRKRTIPRKWDLLIERIARRRIRKIIVLGEMDTGKSFFATYVANKLLGRGIRPAVLDCDIGQSDIGPPGCFGVLVLKRPTPFLALQEPTAIEMVGAHSPALHFLPTVAAFSRMTKQALKSADVLIINTNGWVQGDGGRAMKRTKLEAFDPDLIVLMQRDRELEHLVVREPKRKIVRMVVSRKASFTPPDERKLLREEISRRYMKNARTITIRGFFTARAYYGTGQVSQPPVPVPGLLHAERLSGWEGWLLVTKKPIRNPARLSERLKSRIMNIVAGSERNVMVGLLDARDRCLGIGSLQSLDYARRIARIVTPVRNKKAICTIQFSSLRLDPKGYEAGFVTPGSF
ncbi:MAG: hypothetical protein D6679_09210 [Candidatus Hydrogenedentota bacterium]|nr:MAG: hypothetical protein D6679_09210 [Candidatus Hydrogenedentota bacterium]